MINLKCLICNLIFENLWNWKTKLIIFRFKSDEFERFQKTIKLKFVKIWMVEKKIRMQAWISSKKLLIQIRLKKKKFLKFWIATIFSNLKFQVSFSLDAIFWKIFQNCIIWTKCWTEKKNEKKISKIEKNWKIFFFFESFRWKVSIFDLKIRWLRETDMFLFFRKNSIVQNERNRVFSAKQNADWVVFQQTKMLKNSTDSKCEKSWCYHLMKCFTWTWTVP